MRSFRGRLSYANIVATLALLFAMSGGALAASHYLINSTKQINPKVLKKLKGNRGRRGAAGAAAIGIQGATGPQGVKGATGATGATGPKGTEGAKGSGGAKGEDGFSALSNLPSGASESGTFGLGTTGGTAGETIETSASFPVPLSEGAPESHVITTEVDVPVAHCAGPGQADAGFLCIYINVQRGLDPATKKVFNAEIKPSPGGWGRFGFAMAWTTTAGEPGVFGTFTVTAE